MDLSDPAVQAAIKDEAARLVRGQQATAAVMHATAAKIEPGDHVYVAKVVLDGHNVAAWSFLTHIRKFTREEFAAKVEEACRIVAESRLSYRRQQMALERTPVPNPRELNERLFLSDAQFFEVVMADKWGFRVLKAMMADAILEPTVKLAAPPTG